MSLTCVGHQLRVVVFCRPSAACCCLLSARFGESARLDAAGLRAGAAPGTHKLRFRCSGCYWCTGVMWRSNGGLEALTVRSRLQLAQGEETRTSGGR